MLLHADPSLAEAPGFRKEQLDALARSVELRRQQLEDDINDYIKAKQDELRRYGDEVGFCARCIDSCARLIWA